MNTAKYNFSHTILFIFISLFTLQSCGEQLGNSKIEKKEPILSAVYESYDDLAFMFNQQNDTTYVINFWATWCSPCIAELPYFEQINKTYKDEKLKVILISLDSKKVIDSKLKPFIQKEKLMSHVVALTDPDYNTWIDKVNSDWDGAIPVTIIYNKEEYEIIKGELDSFDELNTIVKSYLNT